MRSLFVQLFSITVIGALFLSAFMTMMACKHDPIALEIVLPDTVSFSRNIIPVFKSSCALSGCHIGSSPAAHLSLDSMVAYKQLLDKHEVDTTVAENSVLYISMIAASNYMPPSGKLDQYYAQLVLKWIKHKAKNN